MDRENAGARRRRPSFLTVEGLSRVQVRVLEMTLPYVARSTISAPATTQGRRHRSLQIAGLGARAAVSSASFAGV